MTRMIFLTLLNLALPFLLRAAWLYALRVLAKRRTARGMKDVTPPAWHFPIGKLLLAGVVLSIISLAVYRIGFVDQAQPFQGFEATTKEF